MRVTELRFTKETDASRYTLHRGDDLVSVLDYRDDERTVAMTRAYTVPAFPGRRWRRRRRLGRPGSAAAAPSRGGVARPVS